MNRKEGVGVRGYGEGDGREGNELMWRGQNEGVRRKGTERRRI